MRLITSIVSSIPPHWWIVLIVCALGVTATCLWGLESDASRSKRAEQKKKRELRSLADKISIYGQRVHQRYPTGDVVVSERDLAEQLRKHPDAIVAALQMLLAERKVQRAPLNEYWKLNLQE
jgi:hypothetical protein